MAGTIAEVEEEQVKEEQEQHPWEEGDDQLTDFVNKNIEVMRRNLSNYQIPTDMELKRLCVQYVPVRLALQKLYSKVKFEALKAKAEFDNFEADAYVNVRNKYNTLQTDKKMFLSSNEIKAMARTLYQNQYDKYESKMAVAESRRSFVERLSETWASYQFILGNLIKMYTAEAYATHIDANAQASVDYVQQQQEVWG